MKIASADVSMRSTYSYVEKHEKQEHLNFWDNRGSMVLVSISEEAREQFARNQHIFKGQTAAGRISEATDDSTELEISTKDKIKIQLIEAMLEKVTGKKVALHVPKKLKLDQSGSGQMEIAPHSAQGWGIDYRLFESYSEQETVTFQASASIRTADGKTIELNLAFAMSRSFYTESSVHIRAGDALLMDPLVINLHGGTASLTEQKYGFDLNADGKLNQISFVGPGSGFLALDRNGDGLINDGTELFGAISGDGFSDLRQYDADGNGWIDESDPIFHDLRIWMKDASGNDQLIAIGQAGIGAIYLGHVDTKFQHKNSQQATLGMLQKTGIYVTEQGRAGTIQHIDLAV